ncbi:MAG: YfcE family phosphodiesterase [Oscillospiraceae bacterium]|nr:YfcE family phosphodiesterase [Oscillospiraceae bacterium]MBR2741064.1 YfcE family phosphodiesterase [Oscillospiraceae bacterium]
MKRLLLISDTHGMKEQFEEICKLHPEAYKIIFLGDGAAEFERIKAEHPDWPLIGVRGNNDFGSQLPYDNTVVVDNWRIFLTHGHHYGVRAGIGGVTGEASDQGCNVVFFGHTHMPFSGEQNGVRAVNPGAVFTYPRSQYAMVDLLDDGKMVVNLTELKDGKRNEDRLASFFKSF